MKSDWKTMRKVKEDLLAALCQRINRQAKDILHSEACSEHERYGRLYNHVNGSNNVVADCFDDWRRSTLIMKLASMQHHGLLTPEIMEQLSEETQKRLKAADI